MKPQKDSEKEKEKQKKPYKKPVLKKHDQLHKIGIGCP